MPFFPLQAKCRYRFCRYFLVRLYRRRMSAEEQEAIPSLTPDQPGDRDQPQPSSPGGELSVAVYLLKPRALTDVAVHHKIRGFDSRCKRSAVDGKPAFVIHDHVFHKIAVGPVVQHPIPVVLFYKLAAFQFPDGLADRFFIHIAVFSNHSRFDHSVLKAVRPGEQICVDKHSLGGQGIAEDLIAHFHKRQAVHFLSDNKIESRVLPADHRRSPGSAPAFSLFLSHLLPWISSVLLSCCCTQKFRKSIWFALAYSMHRLTSVVTDTRAVQRVSCIQALACSVRYPQPARPLLQD